VIIAFSAKEGLFELKQVMEEFIKNDYEFDFSFSDIFRYFKLN